MEKKVYENLIIYTSRYFVVFASNSLNSYQLVIANNMINPSIEVYRTLAKKVITKLSSLVITFIFIKLPHKLFWTSGTKICAINKNMN